MNNEFLLQDRIQKIQQVIGQYGEDKFCLSYSGGKDSNVLSALVDMALPNNRIPRVYADTGIELNAVRDFVKQKCEEDDRFIMVKPKVPIKQMLEQEGYPFKSKHFSQAVYYYRQQGCRQGWVDRFYKGVSKTGEAYSRGRTCPNIVKYLLESLDATDFPISDRCCTLLKERPLDEWKRENNKPYYIIGIMTDEGGRRQTAKCLAFKKGKFRAFQPLVAVTKGWENWFIQEYDIKLPILYYPPYNFDRTGCKGCPFDPYIGKDLETLEKYFPAEAKQCEYIWAPVYAEYRRLNYRLKNKQ